MLQTWEHSAEKAIATKNRMEKEFGCKCIIKGSNYFRQPFYTIILMDDIIPF